MGLTTYSYYYGSPQLYRVETRSSSLGILNVFSVGYMREVGVAKWFKLQKKQEILDKINIKGKEEFNKSLVYLVLFRLKAIGGVSYYRLHRSSDDNKTQSASFGDAIISNRIIARNNIALFGGFTLQFFNYNKNLFQLTFLYSQGLFNQVTTSIDYRLGSQTYDHQVVLGSRGSYFTLQLAYPIRIWR